MATNTDPVDGAVLDGLRQCSTPAIADTNHDGVGVLNPEIKRGHDDCRFAGRVRTIELHPSALHAPVRSLDSADEGDVLVVDTDGTVDEAVWGELLSTYAIRRGVNGMVTNGAIRDIDGIRDLGFPVFARTTTPRGPSGSEEATRNAEVVVGDVSIAPGDVLVGDESGVVAIERVAAEGVRAAAEDVVRTEEAVTELIGSGYSLAEAFDEAGMG